MTFGQSDNQCGARRGLRAASLGVLAMLVAGCSMLGSGEEPKAKDPAASAPAKGNGEDVVLATHESFNLDKKLVKEFERESGYHLVIRQSGDAGTLATKLALTAKDPIGDVAFGVDNTFASRTLEAGVFAAGNVSLPAGAERFALIEGSDQLVPVDVSDVCVNVDTVWFEKQKLAVPKTLDDLIDPAYRDLFVIPGATTSSPGMAFLLTTISAKGKEWPTYWQDLMANGAKIVDGWSDAYFVDFSGGGDKGERPIVVSYDSSPAFTVAKDGKSSSTAALLDTCFRQVEYIGVLNGAKNPAGAKALIEFMLTKQVQESLPTSMYVYPVIEGATLPPEWATFAVQPEQPWYVDPSEIAVRREEWLQEWTDITTR